MKIILDIATLLGGIAALAFFWQQLATIRMKRYTNNRLEPAPPPSNKIPRRPTRNVEKSIPMNTIGDNTVSLRQRLLKDIRDDSLRAVYLESRSAAAETYDKRRVVYVRLTFGLTIGVIIWFVFFLCISEANWFLSGVRNDLARIIVWTFGGGTSGVVYGIVRGSMESPPRYESKRIVKEIGDFWLTALIWFFGVGILGYFTAFFTIYWSENATVRIICLSIWLVGYAGAAVLTFGPKGSVYQHGAEVAYLARPGPLPLEVYLFGWSGLSLHGWQNHYDVDNIVRRVRDSIKAVAIVFCIESLLTAIATTIILEVVSLIVRAYLT